MLQNLIEPVLQRYFTEGDDEYPDGWGATIEGVRVSWQKELRIIQSLEPPMNQGRLCIDPSVARNEELQRQMTRITRERNCLRHDDELEALAMCVKQWEEVLARDPAKGAAQQRQRWIEEKTREHYIALGLIGATGDNWIEHH